jgi:uncharacterized protein
MKKILLLALAVLLLSPSALSAYTKPGNPTGFVNDYAKLFSADERAQLEAKLSGFNTQTGNEVAVVSIETLEGEGIENFAEALFQDWGIGKAGEDNGILLLISKGDREMRIEVGYGLEPYITDIEASHLIQNVLTPAFRQEKYFDGVDEATGLIMAKLEGNYSPAFAAPVQESMPDYNNYFIFGIFGLLFLSRLFAQTRSWWLGGAIGAAAAIVVTFFFGFVVAGLIAFLVLVPLGLFIDFIFSRIGPGGGPGGLPGMGSWGGRGGSSSGGFGGFGGGSSGGGGASGRW